MDDLISQEAEPIANVFGREPDELLGHVYQWESGEIGILWLKINKSALYIRPPISLETLRNARSQTSDTTLELLWHLSEKP